MVWRFLKNSGVMEIILCAICLSGTILHGESSWTGILRDAQGIPVPTAEVALKSSTDSSIRSVTTTAAGTFTFSNFPNGHYQVTVTKDGKIWRSRSPFVITAGASLRSELRLTDKSVAIFSPAPDAQEPQASGGEHLSSAEVSSLPLNKRDFSQLLLLAAGTMTDANGAANFTQQFAVNGQRGTATVFALDGADSTDPEMGGATFSNFNVDAIQEVQASSGVLPAEIGHGAASYTNVITKSGTDQLHGSVFEFVRNAAFDARNFFDRRSLAEPGRIPPFARNEFGFTLGGPVVFPGIYNGHHRTYFFGQYQGFRQVLGTTQVMAVPTEAERHGIDTTSYPGDVLTVPVNPQIVPVLDRYPLPNDPQGAYGARTYATSSKVATRTDQFSIRTDHRLSDKATFFARFSLNQVTGPLTNPDQTAIDPSFAIRFFDHQRNLGLKYTRTLSPNLISESLLGYERSTPLFPTVNNTQPAIMFGDGSFEAFNSADGSIMGSYGNLYQIRQSFAYTRGTHAWKWGFEARYNKDSTVFGTNPNGMYSFGGGTAYSPVYIPSVSGQHDIQAGDPLPDALTGLLTASPFSYSTTALSKVVAQGDKFDEDAVRRQAYNFYFQDTWKAAPRLTINYGVRYEMNGLIHESKNRTSSVEFVGPDGAPATFRQPGTKELEVLNPQPPYYRDWRGWGPRLSIDYSAGAHTVLHAGGAIATALVNLWQDNFIGGGIPFSFSPYISAMPGVRVAFQNSVTQFDLPDPYTTAGQLVFPTGRTTDVPANTVIDMDRFEKDLAALTPGHQVQLVTTFGIARNFRNGYIGTYSLGVDHDMRDVKLSAAYVATVGVHLASVFSPNSYAGASPQFAPFTQFDSQGQVLGGFSSESVINSGSHSTYHALQTSLTKNSARAGLGFQASYTYSKSMDDTSAALGGFFGTAGVILQTFPQDPWNPGAEKGPSTFDVTHTFTFSVIEMLPLERVRWLRPLGTPLVSGWQVLNISTFLSGSPFSVFSGIQQTGVGAGGTDRPDQIAPPVFSTSRTVREDYFGRGADNGSFFRIPIDVAGGTGPNQGRFGTLGRNTFRGPGFENYDFAVIKDTALARRANTEPATLQFRAEFFNVFNLANFGLPSNIVRGSGFGIISKTAGPSRQIQFSLKLLF
jgi:Carboxypeptidase regulatory-like domain